MAFLLNNMTTEQLNKKTISIGIIVSIVLFFAALVVTKLFKDVLFYCYRMKQRYFLRA